MTEPEYDDGKTDALIASTNNMIGDEWLRGQARQYASAEDAAAATDSESEPDEPVDPEAHAAVSDLINRFVVEGVIRNSSDVLAIGEDADGQTWAYIGPDDELPPDTLRGLQAATNDDIIRNMAGQGWPTAVEAAEAAGDDGVFRYDPGRDYPALGDG
jgi:hypothetical protein